MGHRTVKRVPLDFDWPRGEVWEGYLLPDSLRERQCASCEGMGYSPRAAALYAQWYGRVPFDPADTGSQRLTSETPEVRAVAQRHIDQSPGHYGTGKAAVRREALRLADLWNRRWSHHLEQADVDALIAAGRLYALTHTWAKDKGWQPRFPSPTVTAAQVNAWSLDGFGHDATNCHIAIKAKCAREGAALTCADCDGRGHIEVWPGQRAAAEAWQPTEPPDGEGWQLWSTTCEGAPVSPVFASARGLAQWCEHGATIFADERLTAEQWLESFGCGTTETDSLFVMVGPEQTDD